MTLAVAARKIEKLRRYWLRRLKPASHTAVFWHVGRPNFGDDINPLFFERISGRGVRFAADRQTPHFLGIGSILERATTASTVIGSGFLNEPKGTVPKTAEIVSLRGTLSRSAFPGDSDIWLGDPLVLVDRVVAGPRAKTHRYGYVPHVSGIDRAKAAAPKGLCIIDPSADPWRVIDMIAACENVMSQSLHGLIVADALGIPNLWVSPSDRMAGGRFKFDDYFSTLDEPKQLFAESESLFAAPPASDFGVSRYMHDKARYLAILTAAFERGAAGRTKR